MRSVGSEEDLTFRLARYITLRHPSVIAHFDFGSGTKLTMGQAVKQRRLNRRAFPDLTIARPVTYAGQHYCGLFLEFKREGTRLHKRDGSWASEHLAEQAAVIDRLRAEGYIADFAVGFDQAIEAVDSYLAGDVEQVKSSTGGELTTQF